MPPADTGTCRWLVDELLAARLADREVLEAALEEFTKDSPYVDADALAGHLTRSGIISKLQARRALDGEARKLLMGAYVLEEVIANGSLGPVYLARGRADHKPYAIKVLPKRSWNLKLAREQVRAFEQLPPHEGVVTFLDVGSAHGLHYLVWPFAQGRTLEKLVREHGPLSPGEAARVGLRIADVLKVCHPRRIVHGFIKPSNVMIGEDGQAKLLDFGIGAMLAENSEDDFLVDTVSRAEALAQMLECAAPESIADSAKWQPAGDVYSLGCTLYFALAGRYPFPGGSFVDKIVNHQTVTPTPLRSLNPDVPDSIAEIIGRMMQKHPNDRYRKLEHLIEDLAPLATASVVVSPVPVNVETPAPKAKLRVREEPPDIQAQTVPEPAILEMPPQPKRGLLGRLFGGKQGIDDHVYATVVAPGGPLRPGRQAILHVYIHRGEEGKALADAGKRQRQAAHIVGTARTRREVPDGDRVGLHLAVSGLVIPEPMQEFQREPAVTIYRFLVNVPEDCPRRPLKGRLMIGHEGLLIGQADFMLVVEK